MKKNFLPLLFLFFFTVNKGFGQDRLFTYTYQSNVLNKDQREIEISNTLHMGRKEYYRALKHRIEFETGISGRVQTACYLNLASETMQVQDSTSSSLVSSFSMSFSNEWKYKFSDPVANSIGFALYGEYTISQEEIALEGKLIFDKSIGHSLHALNLVVEQEFETELDHTNTKQESTLFLEANYGFSYQVTTNFRAGFELQNTNKTNEDNGWVYSALYGGPCFSYVMDKCWFNFTFMPQLSGLHYYKTGEMVNGKILTDNEKIQARLICSFAF